MSKHETDFQVAAPTVNVANVLRVADAIERCEIAGLGFNMLDVYQRAGSNPDLSGHDCKTTACIAGWTNAVLRPGSYDGDHYATSDEAADLLGLDLDQAEQLFFGAALILYNSTPQAVRTLRHLAATAMIGAPEVRWDLPA